MILNYFSENYSIINQYLKRFWKNKIAVIGAVNILILILVSILGYIIAPDNIKDANSQQISLKLKKPGFKIQLLELKPNQIENNAFCSLFIGEKSNAEWMPIESNYSFIGDSFQYKRYKQPYFSYLKISIPKSNFLKSKIQNKTYFLGTDGLGRDVLSRLIIGARISIIVGLVAVFISLIIGTMLGMLSGYYGGWIDKIILWLINVFWAIPTVLLAMVLLMSYRGESQYKIFVVFVAVGLTMWVDTSRMIRGLILELKERQFVEAGRALAFSDFRLVFKHIFPNTFSALIVITASNFASAILMESGLSYLGLGVQPPKPSWGSMLREYYTYLGTEVSYLAIFPGLCIMFAVFSFYIFGNGLRDAFDVKG